MFNWKKSWSNIVVDLCNWCSYLGLFYSFPWNINSGKIIRTRIQLLHYVYMSFLQENSTLRWWSWLSFFDTSSKWPSSYIKWRKNGKYLISITTSMIIYKLHILLVKTNKRQIKYLGLYLNIDDLRSSFLRIVLCIPLLCMIFVLLLHTHYRIHIHNKNKMVAWQKGFVCERQIIILSSARTTGTKLFFIQFECRDHLLSMQWI